jgi:hypothetical protein
VFAGQDEDAGRHDLQVVEGEAAVPEHGGRHLREDAALHLPVAEADELLRRVLGVADVGQDRERRDADEHRHGETAHERQRRRGVPALGLAEGRDAVGDRLDAGQGRAAGREGPQRQEGEREPGQAGVLLLGQHLVVGALGPRRVTGGRLEQPVDDHRADAQHEPVRGHGEGPARLLDAAQVHRRQERDAQQGQRDAVVGQPLEGTDDVVDPGRDRHGDRQHVVDEQCAGHDAAAAAAQVHRRDLVVAATRRVGPHQLAVGQDDDRQQQDDAGGQVRGEVEVGQPTEREHDEQLLRGVRDARQRVAREDRQGEVLGQLLLAGAVAAQRASEDDPLDDDVGPRHVPGAYGAHPGRALLHAGRTPRSRV